jgi:RecB family exonuclease
VQRELPFLLRLPDRDRGPAIFLKGTIDLLVEEEDGTVSVVDYKSGGAHPAGLAPYRFQLACYALAAWELSGRQAQVRAGVSFLGAPDAQPVWDGALPGLDTWAHHLRERAEGLLEAGARGDFPGQEPARCSALHCGHLQRCHPGADAW